MRLRPTTLALFFVVPLAWLSFGAQSVKPLSVVSHRLGSWVNGGRVFLFSGDGNYFLVKNKTPLVMVSFMPGSEFANSLERDSRTLAYYSSRSTGIGRALMNISDTYERDQLAGLAHEDIEACGAIELIDPSLNLNITSLGDAASPLVPTSVKSTSVASRLDEVSEANIRADTLALQNMNTRYHRSAASNTASDSILNRWQSLLPVGASVTMESHSESPQKSVVLTIPSSFASSETVVIGAHLDSIHKPDNLVAPGADDDASGVAALTEMIRIIRDRGMVFRRNIEFHAYAAEEAGLIGSADIAAKKKSASANISAMLQLDMIGYSSSQSDETLHIIKTDTSPVLVRHLKDLASIYLGNTWKTGELSAGTSDHKSWNNLGFHAAFAFENPQDYNRALHTADDTIDRLNFKLAAKFTKLALAFLSHEAGYTAAISETSTEWAAQQGTSDGIKLASVRGSDGGDRLVAAVSAGVASVEFCRISAGTSIGCQAMVTDTSNAKQNGGRSFFVTASDVTINANDVWRVTAYSASGTLIATRSMRLAKN